VDAANRDQVRTALREHWKMRVGNKLKRTLYLHDPKKSYDPHGGIVIGIVDSEALAAEIMKRWNANG
jgi:hypothetical protein